MRRIITVLILISLSLCQVWGESPYTKWANGPSDDPSFFPIAVWLQQTDIADTYAAMGINMYFNYLGDGTVTEKLADIDNAGLTALARQSVETLNSSVCPDSLARPALISVAQSATVCGPASSSTI